MVPRHAVKMVALSGEDGGAIRPWGWRRHGGARNEGGGQDLAHRLGLAAQALGEQLRRQPSLFGDRLMHGGQWRIR